MELEKFINVIYGVEPTNEQLSIIESLIKGFEQLSIIVKNNCEYNKQRTNCFKEIEKASNSAIKSILCTKV